MRNYLDLGCTPGDEECEQLGETYRPDIARLECRVYIRQLKRINGEPPVGAGFRVAKNNHDFGVYFSVEVWFNDENKSAADYACRVESEMPENWDDQAKIEINAWLTEHGELPRFAEVNA